MENNYKDLHLELIEIPDDYEQIVTEEGQWEYDEHPAIYLVIQETQKGMDFGFDLDPFADESEDMEELNRALEAQGCEINGYGWDEFLFEYIADHAPKLAACISRDSESDTCGLYLNETIEEYKLMLGLISSAIRELVDSID